MILEAYFTATVLFFPITTFYLARVRIRFFYVVGAVLVWILHLAGFSIVNKLVEWTVLYFSFGIIFTFSVCKFIRRYVVAFAVLSYIIILLTLPVLILGIGDYSNNRQIISFPNTDLTISLATHGITTNSLKIEVYKPYIFNQVSYSIAKKSIPELTSHDIDSIEYHSGSVLVKSKNGRLEVIPVLPK